MGPIFDYKTALDLRPLPLLRYNQNKDYLPIIENFPREDIRSFWEGSYCFLKGDYVQAARHFHNAEETGLKNPLSKIQEQLQTDEEENFLKLLDMCESFYGLSETVIGLKGLSLIQLHRLYEAEMLIRQSLRHSSQSPNLKTVLVKILCEQGAFGEAIALLHELSRQLPKSWNVMNNLGYIFNNVGDVEKALTLYRQAISIAPNETLLRVNHSIALLKIGRFAQGWQEHEWRLKLPFHTSLPYKKILPTLTPGTSLKGKKILITHEEGLGDSLMYARYIPLLSETGASIHVWGSEQLSSLIDRIEGVNISQVGGTCPDYDYHCPFISLPRALTLYPSMPFNISTPYLSLPPTKLEEWRKKLAAIPPHILRVGLVWAGGVHENDRSSRLIDYHRSMNLEELAPLFGDPLIQYFSLQKGPKASQQSAYSHIILNYMDDCKTMEDTAALIEALDLVVTVDTSIVHLAGALGKETILMDRFCNCWRWGINQTRTEWYPSVRIYRQPYFDDWRPVIRTIARDLTERALHKALS